MAEEGGADVAEMLSAFDAAFGFAEDGRLFVVEAGTELLAVDCREVVPDGRPLRG